jgi:hypothetical protein
MTVMSLRMRLAFATAVLPAALSLAAPAAPAVAATARYEAETATISQGVVEANHLGFSGTGFVNYDNVVGSYVQWTVTASAPGTATLVVGFSNGTTTDRPMDITVNGALVADDLSFAPTANWDTWQTRTVTAAVVAGTNTVRATAVTANGGPNVDYLDVSVSGAGPDYQAEDAMISQGVVEANHLGYTGTGFVNYDNVIGSYVQWTVTADQAGPAGLTLRYANGTTANRPMDITVNGALVADELAFGPTADWDTWQTTTVTATLAAGANTVRASATTTGGGPNVDRLTVGAAPSGRIVTVSSIAQLQSAANAALPGDRIELTDGTYTVSSPIQLTRSGTATAPVTVAAQHTGAATLTGSAGFQLGTVAYVGIEGFRLTHAGGFSIPGSATHIRFTRNLVQISGSATNWVTVAGNDAEVDHNTFQHKSTEGVFLQITGAGAADMSQRAHIHHNYFFDHSFTGSNGGESIRLGYSYRQLASAYATVEYNLFEAANGDSEAISVKSSDNVIRYNTLRDSRGSIVLRHGNRNRVEGNMLLGGESGIRLYENDHVVVNNVIQGGTGQLIIGSGTMIDDTSGGTEHARADRALVAFNTIVGSGVLLDVGTGDPYGPDDCTFADNIFQGSGSGGAVNIDEGTNLHWQGNIVWAASGGEMPSGGYRSVNPLLAKDAAGLYRLSSATSPAIDTATGTFSQVTLDVDGQVRSSLKDVGADEYATSGNRRPLTTADVGALAP